MHDHDLIKQLAQADEPSRHSPNCLDAYRLAAIGAGAHFSTIERRHVADCRHCIERLADLSRISRSPPAQPVAAALLERARRPGTPKPAWRPAPRWAAAAVLVLAVGVFAERFADRRGNAPDQAPNASMADREVRSIDPQALRPEIISPLDGAGLAGAGPQFEWTALPGSMYYELRLVTLDGALVWETRVSATNLALPDTLHLEPGEQYYVRVDAFLAEAGRVSSKHVLFTVGAER